ncbi:hypothetical protein AOQ84DRAFT_254311, partial [Glonium stellatum]
LPLELREAVYGHYFAPASHLTASEGGGGKWSYSFDFNLYYVSRQVYREARKVFRRELNFIRVETPWPETAVLDEPRLTSITENHVALEGAVPIVASSRRAEEFNDYHLLVSVDTPRMDFSITKPFNMIILLSDLHLFCRIWYYSALSYPGLNSHLRLTLRLQNPYSASPEEAPIRNSLQRQLLMPFGKVKGLDEVLIEGCDESVKAQLEADMEIPYDSPEKCFEDATKLMEEGTEAFRKKEYEQALKLYMESFRTMHILCNGRERSILADAYFQIDLSGGTYDGQNASIVRLILRVKLVARVIDAYLKLKEWGEAKFWGMRSISLMREAIGSETLEYIPEFIAAEDMAMIYLRTAIA